MQPIPGTSSSSPCPTPMGALPGSSLTRTLGGPIIGGPALGGFMGGMGPPVGMGGAMVGASATAAAVASAAKAKRENSVFRKIAQFLQDNRVKPDDKVAMQRHRAQNKEQADSNQSLKKVLNIIFLTTGLALLVAVVIVIIYTSITSSFGGGEVADADMESPHTQEAPVYSVHLARDDDANLDIGDAADAQPYDIPNDAHDVDDHDDYDDDDEDDTYTGSHPGRLEDYEDK